MLLFLIIMQSLTVFSQIENNVNMIIIGKKELKDPVIFNYIKNCSKGFDKWREYYGIVMERDSLIFMKKHKSDIVNLIYNDNYPKLSNRTIKKKYQTQSKQIFPKVF